MKDQSQWKLDWQKFLNRHYGPQKVDLFATRLTNQCCYYFSWRTDPLVQATNAFLHDWTSIRVYANPPWKMISCILMKTQMQGADAILVHVAPLWKAQPWYALLLAMLVDWLFAPRLKSGITNYFSLYVYVWWSIGMCNYFVLNNSINKWND